MFRFLVALVLGALAVAAGHFVGRRIARRFGGPVPAPGSEGR